MNDDHTDMPTEEAPAAPVGDHNTRVPLALTAMLPPPVVPEGCPRTGAQLEPLFVENARLITPLAESPEPARHTMLGASSAKSMLDVAKPGFRKNAVGTTFTFACVKPLMSPNPLNNCGPLGGLARSSTAVSSMPTAFTLMVIWLPESQAVRLSLP